VGLQDDLVETFSWVAGHANIWPWFADARLFAAIVEALAEPFQRDGISKVAGIEARGFLLAGAVARELDSGVIPVRKRGAVFPGPHVSVTTSPDYRGRSLDLLIQDGALSRSDRVLIVDDWLETGSQVKSAVDVVQEIGAQVVGVAVIVDQSDGTLQVPRFHSLVSGERLGPSG
jgi:adenine phosphoribosyltransferase